MFARLFTTMRLCVACVLRRRACRVATNHQARHGGAGHVQPGLHTLQPQTRQRHFSVLQNQFHPLPRTAGLLVAPNGPAPQKRFHHVRNFYPVPKQCAQEGGPQTKQSHADQFGQSEPTNQAQNHPNGDEETASHHHHCAHGGGEAPRFAAVKRH